MGGGAIPGLGGVPGRAALGNAAGSMARSAGMANTAIARGAGGSSSTSASMSGFAGGVMYQIGESISVSIAKGMASKTDEIVFAGKAITTSALSAFDGVSSLAYTNGQLTALGFADGMQSQYGTISTIGKQMNKNVFAGFKGADLSKVFKALNPPDIFTGPITKIPFIGTFLRAINSMFRKGIQQNAFRNSPTAQGVTTYNYYHNETTNNNFDGGLVGDMELQGRRVLDVLEQSSSTRRVRNLVGEG